MEENMCNKTDNKYLSPVLCWQTSLPCPCHSTASAYTVSEPSPRGMARPHGPAPELSPVLGPSLGSCLVPDFVILL